MGLFTCIFGTLINREICVTIHVLVCTPVSSTDTRHAPLLDNKDNHLSSPFKRAVDDTNTGTDTSGTDTSGTVTVNWYSKANAAFVGKELNDGGTNESSLKPHKPHLHGVLRSQRCQESSKTSVASFFQSGTFVLRTASNSIMSNWIALCFNL